jgi:GT2 family glycosyltransferase
MLLENSENHGFAKAVNMGLQRATGEFVLLLNPDAVIRSESFYPVIDFLRRNPNIGICGCKLLNGDGSLQYSTGSFPTLFSTLSRMVLPRPMRKYCMWDYDKIRGCDWVTGAFMLIRRCLIKKLGYFDEKYFMYYEDVDYCLQAKRKGWEIYYYPGIIIRHLNPHAMVKKSPAIENQIRRSRTYFFRKNSSVISHYIMFLLTRLNPW